MRIRHVCNAPALSDKQLVARHRVDVQPEHVLTTQELCRELQVRPLAQATGLPPLTALNRRLTRRRVIA